MEKDALHCDNCDCVPGWAEFIEQGNIWLCVDCANEYRAHIANMTNWE